MEQTKKRTQLIVRVTEDLAKRFRVACALEEIKMQTFLEQVIEDFVSKVEKKKAD